MSSTRDDQAGAQSTSSQHNGGFSDRVTPGRPVPPPRSFLHELNDHTRVLVRPLQPSDRQELAARYERLSEEARRRRFFNAPARLSEVDLEYLTNLDYRDHFAWAAFALDEPGKPGIGVARYVRDRVRPDHAEVAVTVIDEYQRRGLGTLLLRMLADQARANGITSFDAHILWENREILESLSAAGARVEAEEPGIARVSIEIPAAESLTLVEVLRAALRAFGHAHLAHFRSAADRREEYDKQRLIGGGPGGT